MLICAIRTVLIYALVMLSVRIMGKRQISELRPSELVAALLISDLAAVPMQETGTPLLYGIVPICILVALELILSGVMLKFPAVSRLLSGNPVPVILDGKPDIAALKKLRLTVEDLTEAMRMQNVFCFDEVAYAVVERGGCITLYPRPAAKPVTCGDVGAVGTDSGMPALVVSDGSFCPWGLALCGKSEKAVRAFLAKHGMAVAAVFLMTVTPGGDVLLLTADGRQVQKENAL